MLETSNSPVTTARTEALEEKLLACRQFPAVVSVDAQEIDPLSWLNAQSIDEKFAWSDRGCDEIIVGLGSASSIAANSHAGAQEIIRECRRRLGGNDTLRFYGGFSFDGGDAWQTFAAGRFVLPRFVIQGGRMSVMAMDRADVDVALMELRRLVHDVPAFTTDLPVPIETKYMPTKDGWQSNVDEALTLIRREVLEKIVLARKTTMSFDAPLNPLSLTARIADATYDCFVFCFQFDAGRAFVGATPERLFKRSGRKLLSEVVAGTRPRGRTSGDDQRLAYDLLTSEKDQLEHDIVRKSIRQKLHKYVEELEVDDHASVLRLARKQHLCSEVEAVLKNEISEGDLLKRLHPTPAVGGYPTENALPEIARLEPFNRGWYAAPIGWIGADDAEFVVGIRSGLVENDTLSLYSGAGIVKGSDPDQEWEEVDNKIHDFLDILGS